MQRACKVSTMEDVKFPTHPHPLRLARGPAKCFACVFHSKGESYYRCSTCPQTFHKECAESPLSIQHPYHPRHPLTIIARGFFDTAKQCDWCKRKVGLLFYHCALCNFTLHLFCASEQPLLEIEPPAKSHEHNLVLLPRHTYFTCNACGFSGNWFPIYTCVPCDFMVHKDCLELPRVIRISRHEHRVSRVPYLPPREWFCGLCQEVVDGRYQAFSCTKGCGFVAHSKCATTKDVWDGKELEGVPEEEDEFKDVAPFEVIEGDGRIIRHFSHEHHLRLSEDSNGCDENKRCQACVLPVYYDDFYYTCVEHGCGFILHKTCANCPRKKRHGLHPHPIALQVGAISTHDGFRSGFYFCSTCSRCCCGFRYVCDSEADCRFIVDVRCASISEPLNHKGHPHPLYFISRQIPEVTCGACKEESKFVLICRPCNFLLCFKCATLPDTVRYKHDEHPLTLCCGEDVSSPYWCEICEKEMDATKWFYTCDDCCVTVHAECLLGSSPYTKPGHITTDSGINEFDIVPSNRICRPLCHSCEHRCRDAVVFKQGDNHFCSYDCAGIRKMYFD